MPQTDPPPGRVLHTPEEPARLRDAGGAWAGPEGGAATPRRRTLLVIVTLLLLAAVVYMQRPSPPDPAEAREATLAATVTPPTAGPFILLGKALLGLKDDVPQVVALVREQIDAPSFGEPSAAEQVRAVMLLIATDATRDDSDASGALALPGLGQKPPRPLPQVLDDVEKGLAPESPLHATIDTLRPLLKVSLSDGATEADIKSAVESLPEKARADLKQHHGWFADVLLSAGDDQAPVRVQARSQAVVFALFMAVLGGGIILAFLAGLVLLILGIVWKSDGRLRFRFAKPALPEMEPARASWARALWLETVTVFLLGFLSLKLVIVAVDDFFPGAPWSIWVALLGQWALVACIFWPVVRGLTWPEWRAGIGWHAPRGVGREIGAGLCTYLAALPVYFGMALVVVVLMFIVQAVRSAMGLPEQPAPTNRITEIVSGGGPLVLATVFLLATVWAPIVEESIFRGALYRHLRGRYALLGAAFLSAAAFALMHGYVAVQLLMVFTLGFVFAVMREWRNSIVPSASAHCLHNGFALTVMLIVAHFMHA